MPPKRPATNSASSSRVKRAKQSTRPVTITNIRTNASRRLDDVKILKVPNPRGRRGAFTIVAAPRAKIGDSDVIDGIRYVVRSAQQLRRLVEEGRYTDVARTCTSRITNMRGMFKHAAGFNKPIGHWDTSKVTDMMDMFSFAGGFNQPIGGWNTRSVTTMYGMFSHAYAFNQPIGGWNTSRVQNMTFMFNPARRFSQDISAWNVRSVRQMMFMFSDAPAFINQDLSAWATKLSRGVYMDDVTRQRIYGDPITRSFLSRRYRLHPSANAIDPVMMNRVPMYAARVIAGDVVGKNAHIRYIFHKDTLNAMARHGRGTLRHPSTRAVFLPGHVVPLRSVLHANDAAIYNRVGVNERTVEDVRKNANKSKNKKKNGR